MMARAARRAADGVAWLRAAWGRAAEDRAAEDRADEGRAGGTGPAGAFRAPGPPTAATDGTAAPAGGITAPATGAAVPPGTVPGGYPDASAAADVPRWLRVSAGWAWRLLLLAALLWVAGKGDGTLSAVW